MVLDGAMLRIDGASMAPTRQRFPAAAQNWHIASSGMNVA
jgi:hypothetical protein